MIYRLFLLFILSTATLLGGYTSALAQSSNDEMDESLSTSMDEGEVYDPWEPFNRKVYRFNEALDKYMLQPTARGYRKVVPAWGRERVHLFLRNLSEPLTFVNAVLQVDSDRAITSFWRFAINSTWGVGGMFDIAGQEGLVYRDEDFGQTLGRYGVGPGPYLMLPILGPSNPRDALGKGVDVFTDPFNLILDDEQAILWARYGVNLVDTREQLLDITDEVELNSFDPYAAYRSIYMQNRASKIRNGESSK